VGVPLGINNYSIDGKRVIVVIVFNNHIARNTKLGLGVLNHHQEECLVRVAGGYAEHPISKPVLSKRLNVQ